MRMASRPRQYFILTNRCMNNRLELFCRDSKNLRIKLNESKTIGDALILCAMGKALISDMEFSIRFIKNNQ